MGKSLLKSLVEKGRSLGPYVLLELFMPGGTLIALALWWMRQNQARRA